VLRIDAGLHGALREAARESGVSLNEYCARKLAAPAGGFPAFEDAAGAVSRAAALLGGDLIAVVAFGSWARGEAAAGSDVDLLVVAESAVELTRELYRRWDTAPVVWGERTVDAHFVHLPAPEAPATGMWGEVAIDGIVLFERGLRLTRHLIRVRHDIAGGRIVRRMAHGQPYWTEVA
jgi:predicted nucleotidyltransferase